MSSSDTNSNTSERIDLDDLSFQHTARLNEMYVEVKDEFNDCIGKLLRSNSQNIPWLLHPVLTRNPFLSNLPLYVCQLLVAVELIKESPTKVREVWVSSAAHKEVLDKFLKESKCDARVKVKNHESIFLARWFESTISVLKLLIKSIRYFLFKDTTRTSELLNGEPITLIDTYLLEKSIQEGRYVDRYFTGMRSFLSGSEESRLFWLPTILSRFSREDLINIFKNSSENIIYKHDLLKSVDYLKILWGLFSQKFSREGSLYVRSLDISPLVELEFKKNKYTNNAYEGLLAFQYVRRLNHLGVDLKLVIDWNENQPIDRGLILGIHTYFPKTPVKGYQGFIHSDFNYYLQPTKQEHSVGVAPDKVCTISRESVKGFDKLSGSIEVQLAPAFRFSELYNTTPLDKGKIKKKILVALPIELETCLEMLSVVSQSLDLFPDITFEVAVKPHPALKSGKREFMLQHAWREEFELVETGFDTCIRESSMLISAASAAMLESISRGIPVIMLAARSRITVNTIPSSIEKAIWRMCYTHEEVRDAINDFFCFTEEERSNLEEVGYRVREGYFEPTSRRAVYKFLDMEVNDA